VKFICPPVCCCQGAIMALKLSSSVLPQTPRTSTLPMAPVGDAAGDVAVPVGNREGLAVEVGVEVVGAVVIGVVVVGVGEAVEEQETEIIRTNKIPRTIRYLP
jgi:hypothetical protein